jgi:hypothetical protein
LSRDEPDEDLIRVASAKVEKSVALFGYAYLFDSAEGRATEFVVELFETSIHVFLEGISMLGRNNLISVKFSHIGEEAISPKFGVTPLHEGERS